MGHHERQLRGGRRAELDRFAAVFCLADQRLDLPGAECQGQLVPTTPRASSGRSMTLACLPRKVPPPVNPSMSSGVRIVR
jgi:hypothetical protein